jgi:hypothetical protein
MNILFVMEQWCDCNPDCGPSGTHHFYLETWKHCNLGEIREVNYDGQPAQETMDRVLAMCAERRPDLVFFTECWGRASATGLAPLWPILQGLGVPVVTVWHDTARATVWRDLPGIRLNIVADLPQVSIPVHNGLALWVPQNPELFFDTTIPRDISVLYAGSRAPNMKPGLMEWLKLLNFPIMLIGGPREDKLSWSEYAAIYRRAKIGLNFCKLPDGVPQVKCRVWETINSNAMLLEEANPETAKWLRPGVDYVEFHDQRDCEEKIRYYLAHDNERQAIAMSGYRRAMIDYSPRKWWETVLEAIGLELPVIGEAAITEMYD